MRFKILAEILMGITQRDGIPVMPPPFTTEHEQDLQVINLIGVQYGKCLVPVRGGMGGDNSDPWFLFHCKTEEITLELEK